MKKNKDKNVIRTDAVIPKDIMEKYDQVELWEYFKKFNKRRSRGIFLLGFLSGLGIAFIISSILVSFLW